MIKIDKKNTPIIILIALVLIEGFFIYFFWEKKETLRKKYETPMVVSTNDFNRGTEGEIMIKNEQTGQEEPIASSDMPSLIFSTSGTILQIKEDSLIIAGTGNNFADLAPRALTVLINEQTTTFTDKGSLAWKGKYGLSRLQPGMEILLGSSENIRGKTKFIAKDINIIN